jgi:hypothetical protein
MFTYKYCVGRQTAAALWAPCLPGHWSARRRFGLRPQCHADEREEQLASHECAASCSTSSPLKGPHGDLMTKMMGGML